MQPQILNRRATPFPHPEVAEGPWASQATDLRRAAETFPARQQECVARTVRAHLRTVGAGELAGVVKPLWRPWLPVGQPGGRGFGGSDSDLKVAHFLEAHFADW